MDSTQKLTGETLIVHHIPLVHCQVPERQCCGQASCSNPFNTPGHLGLTRTTSLPERDILHRETLVYSSLIQTSASSGSSYVGGCGGGVKGGAGGGRGGSLVSDSSSFTSNASEEHSQLQIKGNLLRCNPFLLDAEHGEDEDCDDIDALSGYPEDCSFHLLGNAHVSNSVEPLLFQRHGLTYAHKSLLGGTWCSDTGHVKMLKVASRLNSLNLSELEHQQQHGNSGSMFSMDCGEQEWGEEGEEEENLDQPAMTLQCCCSCNSCGIPEMLSDSQPVYTSDSSCNSSDGVLVNFSAIYNRMNNAVPAKSLNLNTSAEQSCDSSATEQGGAFYLDLHDTLPEPQGSNPVPCSCFSSPSVVDANCNSYHLPCDVLSSESHDMTSCLQSRARLVLATQNYYKLVTCDLSSQSSPSSTGSSVASCIEEPGRIGPSWPTEYYLFKHAVEEGQEIKEELTRCYKEKDNTRQPSQNITAGQVYVNLFPPECSHIYPSRSRSYDQNLNTDGISGAPLASLECMLSCPVHLSESIGSASPLLPTCVTSFAEIARSKKRNGGGAASTSTEAFSAHSHSSEELSPVIDLSQQGNSRSLPPLPFSYCCSQSRCDASLHPRCHTHLGDSLGGPGYGSRSKAEEDFSAEVARYSKDQRPSTLPIQPFTLQHQLRKPQLKSLRPLLGDYVHQVYGKRFPNTSRPSLLGIHSAMDKQGAPSSSSCSTCSPNSPKKPLRSLSCPLSTGLLPLPSTSCAHGHSSAPPKSCTKQVPPPPPTPPPVQSTFSAMSTEYSHLSSLQSPVLGPCRHVALDHQCEGGDLLRGKMANGIGTRLPNAHNRSSQALKWREYHCKNPLGAERDAATLSGSLGTCRAGSTSVRRNVFDFPPSSSYAHTQPNGQSMIQFQHCYSKFFPDYLSLTEKPPDESCLSHVATSDSISVDLLQKKGLVESINTAVDLIVAHFGTSRDPCIKAKLGNSSVSPNVGHLILKYLCPAIHGILQDGLRAYILDLIIGQRRNLTWSVVESSTRPGPSTRVLHSLFSKVSQYSELTSHNMRVNAFIFGLLNLQSLEFWFNHLYNHKGILAAHYHPWGFLLLSQTACQSQFEELLLLLQPLSLLPFDLDLLFEPRLLQKGQEHLHSKRQLCSIAYGLDSSIQSTFQLMRGQAESKSKVLSLETDTVGLKKDRVVFWNGKPWSLTELVESRKDGPAQKREGVRCFQQVTCMTGNREAFKMNDQRKEKKQRLTQRGTEFWEISRGVPKVKPCGVGKTEKRMERELQTVCGTKSRDRQAGWWYQLMQSSQVYIDNSTESSKFKWEKKQKTQEPRGAEEPVVHCQSRLPSREGVVKGTRAFNEQESIKISSNIDNNSSRANGRASWMGSPPESVVCELKRNREKENDGQGGTAVIQKKIPQGTYWGRLFGASTASLVRKQKNTNLGVAQTQKNRLPSEWLSLNKSLLEFMAQSVGAGRKLQCQAPQKHTSIATQQAEREVTQQTMPWEGQAFCDYNDMKPSHLNFARGDVLRIPGCVEPSWLNHSLDNCTGLCPIVYASLTEEPTNEL